MKRWRSRKSAGSKEESVVMNLAIAVINCEGLCPTFDPSPRLI